MKKHIILCVDDESMVLRSIKEAIRQHFDTEVSVETAESGEEALEIVDFLQERQRTPTVVISDYIMPNMKGDELLTTIHERFPETINVLLTGEASLDGVTNAINEAKLYRYIAKPWEREDLMLTIESAIASYEKDVRLQVQNHQLQELNTTLERQVEERTRQLQKKNEQIEASIRYARRIQQSTLPTHQEIGETFPDYFIFYRPRDVVSGDFYWFARKPDRAVMVAADCTGHGVPGAFTSMIGNELLHRAVNDEAIYDPAAVLEHMDESIQGVWRGERKNREGMDATVCTIDFKANKLLFAGARNPLCYFQDGELRVIKGARRSIDGRKSEIPFKTHTLDLDAISQFYLYSDGFQDQFGGRTNSKFMRKQLWALLNEIHEQPFAKQQEKVAASFNEWKGKKSQTDDVLLMGFSCAFD